MTGYLRLSQLYMIWGMEDKAEPLIKRMIETFPDSPVPYIQFINLKMKQGKLAEAEQMLQDEIARQPEEKKDGELEALLGKFYMLQGRMDDAETAYKDALIESADPADLKATLAYVYVEQGKIADTEKELNELFALDENHQLGKLVKAKLLILQGKNAEAITLLDDLLESNPRWGQAYYQKGVAHLNKGEIELSLKAASEAAKYIPNETKVHTLLAQLYLMKQDYAAAKQEALTAWQLSPTNYRAAIIFGQCLLAEKNYDQALKSFNDMYSKVPNNLEVMHYKAFTHMMRGETEEAKALFKKILVKWPAFAPALERLVGIYLQEGKINDAIVLVQEQLQIVPDNPRYLTMLGLLQMNTGQNDEALATIKKVQELVPNAPQPYILLAAIYDRLGKIDQAISEYQQLLEKNPRSGRGPYTVGCFRGKKGECGQSP